MQLCQTKHQLDLLGLSLMQDTVETDRIDSTEELHLCLFYNYQQL